MSAAGTQEDKSRDDKDTTLALARRLTFALGLRNEDEFRFAVLKRVARRFADDYPEFLRLLLIVACSHDVRARQRVAQAMAVGLTRDDLPSGQLSSWGASTMGPSAETFSATDLTGRFFRGAPQRSLGPLEYLTVWHHQRTQRDALGAEAYCFALGRLIELVNDDAMARERYIARLKHETERQIEGTYTEATRSAMRKMADAWSNNATPDQIAADSAIDANSELAGAASDWVIRPL